MIPVTLESASVIKITSAVPIAASTLNPPVAILTSALLSTAHQCYIPYKGNGSVLTTVLKQGFHNSNALLQVF